MRVILFSLLFSGLAAYVSAECANACNGHGRCTSYDMCICHRNWMSNDCSERVCQFGLAHVDTPKGDLDSSGDVTQSSSNVVENNFVYPYGTTEGFPAMIDSDRTELLNSAHFYMECSNKGTCDRKKGTCKCLPGYDGAACQRASCPGFPKSCSGHGVCKTIQQLAKADNDNIYELWDRHSTMGCECDAGYYGPDCSKRRCKTGVDPLYLDDAATVKYPTMNFATLAYSPGGTDPVNVDNIFYDGMAGEAGTAYWAIRFFDSNGEDWMTAPIAAGANCASVVKALEEIPNDVIPKGTVHCSLSTKTGEGQFHTGTDEYQFDGTADLEASQYRPYTYNVSFWETAQNQLDAEADMTTNQGNDTGLPYSYANLKLNAGRITSSGNVRHVHKVTYGFIYKIKFFGNPGALKQPEIETYLDGDRPSISAIEYRTSNTSSYSGPIKKTNVLTKVWTDGMQGEDKDYFADHCDGVTVRVKTFDNIAITGVTLPQREIHYLEMTDAEANLFKACIGGSDFDTTNNVDSYDWDHGSVEYPHIIKLVRSVTTVYDGGHYAVVIFVPSSKYDGTGLSTQKDSDYQALGTSITNVGGYFELVNPWIPTDAETHVDATHSLVDYDVYTTKGTLALTGAESEAFFGYASNEIFLYNYANRAKRTRTTDAGISVTDARDWYEGGVSCEMENSEKYRSTKTHDTWDTTNFEKDKITYCMDKGDMFIPLAIPALHASGTKQTIDLNMNFNPPNINIYKAEKLWSKPRVGDDSDVFPSETLNHPDHENGMWRHVIVSDLSMNWATTPEGGAEFKIYKFFPAADSTYEYVAECSNRGLCNTEDGVCECFEGYGNDNCDEQNSLAA
jgi:hypothetical protein